MSDFCYYDPKEKVIFLHLSKIPNADTDPGLSFRTIIEIAKSLPEKVWLVVNWEGIKLNKDQAGDYGSRASAILPYIRGVVRYGLSDNVTRVQVRAETIKHDMNASRSNIFVTREEALAAIHNGQVI